VVFSTEERELTALENEGTFGVTDMFDVITAVLVTLLYEHSKIHQSIHLKLVNFIVLKIITQ